MNNRIKHSGVVDNIENDCVKVRIVQSSACSSCNAARICNAAEKKEKIVDIYNVVPNQFKVGDNVTVIASAQVGINAVFYAYGVPFIILVCTVFLVSLLTKDEPVIAIAGMCSLIPYYICLYLMRQHLRKTLSFSIE